MLENKYTSYYISIINNAKNRLIDGYYETHHIIPKSLGGSNLKENLVKLTAREHFVCHLLLTKMYEGDAKNKMVHAAWAMATLENNSQQRYKITSKIYESLRIKYANLKSETLKGKPGRKHSEETKKKLSLALIGKKRKPMSEESKRKLSESMKGKNVGKKRTEEQRIKQSLTQTGLKRGPCTEETKEKLRLANIGKKRGPMNEKTKIRLSLIHKGKPKSKEQVEKQRQKILGRTPTMQERENYLRAMKEGISTCEHCGKITNKGNYNRWHGNNCNQKFNVK
jgi:hypothetical protein